jgi:hypothetical protein
MSPAAIVVPITQLRLLDEEVAGASGAKIIRDEANRRRATSGYIRWTRHRSRAPQDLGEVDGMRKRPSVAAKPWISRSQARGFWLGFSGATQRPALASRVV